MKTTSKHGGVTRTLASGAAVISFVTTLLLIRGTAHAQNRFAMPLVPGHVYELAGLTVGNGNYVSLDWSEMFFAGPITRPVGMFARGVIGVGGSGLGMGLSMNVSPRCPGAMICWRDDDDYFIGPFVSLE